MAEHLEIRWDDTASTLSPWGDIITDGRHLGMIDRDGADWVIFLEEPRRTVTIRPADGITDAGLLAMIRAAAV